MYAVLPILFVYYTTPTAALQVLWKIFSAVYACFFAFWGLFRNKNVVYLFIYIKKATVKAMHISTLIESAGMKRHLHEIKTDQEIVNICSDSRKAGPGSVFVCIKGATADGHFFAPMAYDRGCRVFIASGELDIPDDATVITVRNTRAALADIASAFYGFPSRELKVIGITGTKGKTTSALMAAHILNKAGIPAGYIGTSGISYGGKTYPTVNTTPESLELQRTMREMLDAGMRAVVMEVSSQGLYMGRVRGIRFDTVCFTNFSPDHIGGAEHPTVEHYAACKHKLFTDFGAKAAVYNADDKMSDYMLDGFKGRKRISFSENDRGADFCLSDTELERNGSHLGVSAHVTHGDAEYSIKLPMPGKFNLMNALCAVAATGTLGVPVDTALGALTDVTAAGRFQTVDALPGSGITFVVDYAHNGLALESVLLTLRKYRPRRLICLFGSVGGRTKTRRHELGEVASLLADFCILTADNPDFEDPRETINEIAAAFKPGASCDYIKIPNRTEAVRYAVSIAREGDIVLLAGKGAEDFQLINGQRVPYSDRDALLECAKTALTV